MKKIIFLFLVFAVSSPALAMNWDEMEYEAMEAFGSAGAKAYDKEQANKATLNMVKSFIQAQQDNPMPGNPYDQGAQQADLAFLRSLVENQNSLVLPPDLLSQQVSQFMRRIVARAQRQDQRQRDNKALGELNLMVNRILNGPNFPGETTGQRRRAAGTAALKELSINPDLLSLPRDIYLYHLETFQMMAATPD
jgi:hypothetical protein